MSTQDPTISDGRPALSRITLKVSRIQMKLPARLRRRYSKVPPPCPIRLRVSSTTRRASLGWRRESQNPGCSTISHDENPKMESTLSLTEVHAYSPEP